MSEYRDSSSNNLLSLISGAFIGAAGLAWWLISEADKRKEEKKQKAMMYSSRIQDWFKWKYKWSWRRKSGEESWAT